MTLVAGINHVAIVTSNLDRFIEFYTGIFGLEVVFRELGPAFQHAILRAGPSSWLHPVEVPENAHGTAIPDMLARGHLDHLALTVPSRAAFELVRDRLVAAGASNGAVEDLGAFHSLWFSDPDGMRGEASLIVDPLLSHFHAPVPVPE